MPRYVSVPPGTATTALVQAASRREEAWAVVHEPMSGRQPAPGLRLLTAVVVALIVVTGCGTGQLAQTAGHVTATNGAEGSVGAMLVRDAKLHGRLPVAGDTMHEPGADVPLRVTIISGASPSVPGVGADRLVSVRSPLFAGGRVTGDTRIDVGQAMAAGYDEPVSSVTTTGTTRVGITLLGLRAPLRAGMTYPVTFTFERAGPLTLQLPVANPDFVVPRADGDPRTTR
ncbi:hypothetical protein H7X46_16790 [Pseudonocardia sp. C8]|uniref:hypothetical protein n=1 Tax=Pseudonocardia sp. C8 TaxID=2762759 RepID=UPI0016424E87|nr:hypothetical protein [Pseudonocardia sp. C8]MBC3192724.1 hypothetical protein [Pseudonocardia sp. C8]